MKLHYRIGVDARLLSEKITGIGRYTHQVLSRLTDSGHEWFFYSHQPIIIGDWRKCHIHQHAGNWPGRVLRMLWAQSVLPFAAARDRVDLFWSPAHRLPSLLPNRIARVVTIHDLVWKHAPETMRPLSRWLDKTLMPTAVRMADRVITVSHHTAKDVLDEMPYAAGKVRPIPLGFSPLVSYIDPEPMPGIDLQTPYVLFVGTLEPRKNLARLLQAYAGLPDALKKSARLVIAGGKGWGGVDVQTLTKQYGISDRVEVLGYVSDSQLAALYQHALLLAMPSLYEGFGLPLLEAMARGTPVLTSNCASMPEVAGDAGLLVDPSDVNSIRQGMEQLLGDERVRRALADRSKANAERYSWDRTAIETMKVFEEAISARQAALRDVGAR